MCSLPILALVSMAQRPHVLLKGEEGSDTCSKDYKWCNLTEQTFGGSPCCNARSKCIFLRRAHCRPFQDKDKEQCPEQPLQRLPTLAAYCPLRNTSHARFKACQLNHRFRYGRPSSRLADAGVLVHTVRHKPWLNCSQPICTSGGFPFLSASIIASAYGVVYQWGAPPEGVEGVVLSPATNISCSYSFDGGTMDNKKMCITPGSRSRTCVAGCGDPPQWCSKRHRCDMMRPWRPTHLQQMLMWHAYFFSSNSSPRSHNEVVVPDFDSQRLRVEAVFFTGRAPSNLTFSLLRRLVVAAPGRRVPPLLHLNLTERQNPFRWFKQSGTSPADADPADPE